MDQKLPSILKLKSQKQISELFNESSVIKAYPIILNLKKSTEIETPFKVGFSVSKRNFKLAVHRNKIKRLLRESFRKNKYLFTKEDRKHLFMFVYVGKTIPTYTEINKCVLKIANKLNK